MSEIDGVPGVNTPEWSRSGPPPPQAHENAVQRQTLLVDRHGKPLIVKEPRTIGFRKPA